MNQKNMNTKRLEKISFKDMVLYVEDMDAAKPSTTTREKFSRIGEKLADTFDFDDNVGPNLKRMKAFINKEFDASGFSERYTSQLKKYVDQFTDTLSLMMWVQNLALTE